MREADRSDSLTRALVTTNETTLAERSALVKRRGSLFNAEKRGGAENAKEQNAVLRTASRQECVGYIKRKPRAKATGLCDFIIGLLRLDAERRTAAAGGLHIRIFELEAGAFEGLDVIDDASLEVHHGSGVDEDL